ncbi:MAG: DUF1150 family protein [Alphaproteobacteria bacterium]
MSVNATEIKDIIKQLKELSVKDFQNFGLHQIAYIRSKTEDNKTTYAIFSADGNEIMTAKSHELAIVTAKQNDLDPITVH